VRQVAMQQALEQTLRDLEEECRSAQATEDLARHRRLCAVREALERTLLAQLEERQTRSDREGGDRASS
jgi:hypothetical protein